MMMFFFCVKAFLGRANNYTLIINYAWSIRSFVLELFDLEIEYLEIIEKNIKFNNRYKIKNKINIKHE